MTDKKQPEALAFCWATELAMTQQPVTLSVTEVREVSAEIQLLHAENESLQARIKTMAEEHADELMVAHLDGRMRAAQPAGADRHGLPPLPDPDLRDVGTKPEDIKNFLRGYATEYAKAALAACPTADSVTAPAGAGVAHALSDGQIEAMPVWRNFVGLWPESRREIVDAVVDLLTTPPAQATDSVLEDAARLDWLLLHISGAEFRRIGVHYSGNARRADVDAARAAQEGK